MKCTGINQLSESKLLYASQTLEVAMLDHIEDEIIWNINEAIDRIINNFLFVQLSL